jgi:TonB family protein
MAHSPILGSDPARPVSSGRHEENGAASPALGTTAESDLADLAAKFAAHGGGRVSQELSADLALEVVLNQIVEQACLATGASGAAIALERGGEFVCRASAGGNAPELGTRLDTEAGLSGACVKTRTAQRCNDAQNDPRADVEACRLLGVRSVIILPLLQNGELVAVFEVFSAFPSAFGERDERTLEALSQRILRNLARASEPGPAAVERSKGAEAVGENFMATSIATSTAISNAAAEGDQVSAGGPLLSAASEATSGRGMNIVTLVLGAAVLASAVLLTVLAAQRLGGGRAAAHPLAAVSAPVTGAESRLTGRGGATGAASTASGNQSAGSRSFSTPRPASAAGAGPTGATGTADSQPPAGSLLVYENGREVFRMPSAGEQPDAGNATSAYGNEVERASAVEPAAIVALSPDAAEGSLLHRVEPEYPEEARQQQIQGAVVLDVHIGQDGKVQEVNLLSGPALLAEAATGAVKQWRFKPRLVSGRPVEMQTRITLNFRLPQ